MQAIVLIANTDGTAQMYVLHRPDVEGTFYMDMKGGWQREFDVRLTGSGTEVAFDQQAAAAMFAGTPQPEPGEQLTLGDIIEVTPGD